MDDKWWEIDLDLYKLEILAYGNQETGSFKGSSGSTN